MRIQLVVAVAGLAGCGDPTQPTADAEVMGNRPPITAKGVSTLAGWAESGYVDGNRQINLFRNPTNVALGPDGKLYVADFDNGRLRVVDAKSGDTTTISTPLGAFARPFGIAFASGTLYVGTDNDCQGRHDPAESLAQMSGAMWRIDVAAQSATCLVDNIGRPRGIAALPDGRLAVSDYAHHVIQIFDPSTRTFTPLAGGRDERALADGAGAAARFDTPYAIVTLGGRLIVADSGNHKLRTVALDGTVTTLATGELGRPQGLAVASNGDLFVTDLDNVRVRRVASDGTATSIAGSGELGYQDSEDPDAAKFTGLEGLAVAGDGKSLYIADGDRGESGMSNRVRVIKL